MSTFMANAQTVQPKWIVIDATDLVVGRLAVTISNILRGKHKPDYTPHCDTGDFVIVMNAEKVQFTGKKWEQKEYQDYSHYAGGQKITPAKEMLARKPEEIIRRAVKRMMPRGPLGFKQLGKLKIYAGNQHPHQAQQPQELKLKSDEPSLNGPAPCTRTPTMAEKKTAKAREVHPRRSTSAPAGGRPPSPACASPRARETSSSTTGRSTSTSPRTRTAPRSSGR